MQEKDKNHRISNTYNAKPGKSALPGKCSSCRSSKPTDCLTDIQSGHVNSNCQ